MGKIRIKTLGDEEQEKKQEKKDQKRIETKKALKKEEAPVAVVETATPEKTKEAAVTAKPKKKEKFAKKDGKSARSKNYQTVAKLVDRSKTYSVTDALVLLPQLKRAKFDETVELHINTHEQGISGNVVLPHGSGKKLRIAIADDAIIAKVEKGVIDFDILLAQPQMMPKLARVAKVLGPRGLMPNPKNGTVTANPEEEAKKFEGGLVNFKTEAKSPIIHMIVGKVSYGDKKLGENISVALKAVQTKNIKKMVLKSTMSPGIKLDHTTL